MEYIENTAIIKKMLLQRWFALGRYFSYIKNGKEHSIVTSYVIWSNGGSNVY